jgi:antitoxin component YwqK of YwqJK toxin-antitoxin module
MFKDAILKLTAIFGWGSVETIVVYYYPGGPKKMEETMINGKNEGRWAYWDLEGMSIKTEYYKNGKIVG